MLTLISALLSRADKVARQHVDVPKLCRAKPLDNLEFLQWIKRYFDLHYGGQDYNALERRGGKGGVTAHKENDSGNRPAPKAAAAVKAGAQRVASGASRPPSAAPKKTAAQSKPSSSFPLRPCVLRGFEPIATSGRGLRMSFMEK